MSTFDRLAGLPLEVEGYELEGLSAQAALSACRPWCTCRAGGLRGSARTSSMK